MNKKNMLALCVSTAIAFMGLSCSEQAVSVGFDNGPDIVAKSRSSTTVVSTTWLECNLNKGYIVIDVRSAADYSNGHIPNSVNIPFDIISTWATTDFGGLWLELPEYTALTAALGENGITGHSKVVLVTGLPTETNPYSIAAPGRVAMTLAYAGVPCVALLNGTYEKWAAEGRPVNSDPTVPVPVTFQPGPVADLIVDMEYVHDNLGEMILIDARDAAVYSGEVIEPFANKPGHIPTAVSLPAPSLWNSDGTYKTKCDMQAIASAVIGDPMGKNIVIYCGVGGYASTVWFALTKILHYENVKVFDGSAQEWVGTYDMEM